MVIAYFDCQYGAAGDMLLAALIDAGLDVDAWMEELARIALPANSFSVRISKVTRATISATKVDIDITPGGLTPPCEHSQVIAEDSTHQVFAAEHRGKPAVGQDHRYVNERSGDDEHRLDQGHSHEHGHGDEHHHSHQHGHAHPHEHGPGADHDHGQRSDSDSEQAHSRPVRPIQTLCGLQPEYTPSFLDPQQKPEHGRTLDDVLQIISQSNISERARELGSAIFTRMARAEARVHGLPLKQVHFHEVGAVDAIVDIVGFAIAYDMMHISKSGVSALPVGRGHVQTAHGLLPIPAPAVVNLLMEAGLPTLPLDLNYECLTPTGAAILCEIASLDSGVPVFSRIDHSGYGAGTRNPARIPNVCRVLLGEAIPGSTSRFRSETIVVLESNVDDMTPQSISAFMDLCMESGALDTSVTPCLMKKGRSGHLLTILCAVEHRRRLEELVILHTTSLGVRSYTAERTLAERKMGLVVMEDKWKIAVKLAMDADGDIVNVQLEFDDCLAYARGSGIPLKEVQQVALATYLAQEGLLTKFEKEKKLPG